MLHFRRPIVLLSLLLFSWLSVEQVAVAEPPPPRPNVILILADDLGYADLGSFGATDIFTPNIDRLASEGLKLTNFYMAPSCGVTRAMLLTGSYAPRVSLSRNHTPSARTGIHANEFTLGDMFSSAGYSTGIFGKWHLGDHYQFRPLRHGFDEFYGIAYSNNMWPFHPRTAETPGEDPRLTAARARAQLTGYAGEGSSFPIGEGFPNLPLYNGDTIVEFNTDQTVFGGVYFDRALDFIERHKAEPFFAYIPLSAPHVPLHPSAAFVGTSARDIYGDSVQEIDDGVGRILAKLAELGIDSQTLVIFMSDNGPWLEYGIDGGSAKPLSGGKEGQFEGGIRVPALARWPGQLGNGRIVNEPLSGVDILPTLARLAGVALPKNRVIDGVDAWDLFTGTVAALSRQAIFSFSEGDFTDIVLGAIRSGKWKLHVATNGTTLSPIALYDLSADIGEKVDLRSSEPARVTSLLAMGNAIVSNIAANQRPLGYVQLSGDPFAENAGVGDIISMEAEDAHTRESAGGQSWQVVSLRHSSFESSLQALPNTGTNRSSNYAANSPHLAYRILPEEAARYYVWVRAKAASSNDDSLHVGLNGQAVASGQYITGISSSWSWTSVRSGGARAFVDIGAAGEHVLDVWMREDGLVIDKIVLSTDASFVPGGKGPVESRQSYDGLPAPPTASSDGPYSVVEGGAVTGNPNVLSNDTEPRGAELLAVLRVPPLHAASFELRPDGTFEYVHDGTQSSTDSFTYRATSINGASNDAVASISITNTNDQPVITLLGKAAIDLAFGTPFTDPGATAADEEDGDLTAGIVVGGDVVITSSAGIYTITYNVTDSGGRSATQLTRTVSVGANHPPVLTLRGQASINVAFGAPFTDPGATAIDVEDGDISANIVVGGDTVDTGKAGTYTITYDVMDSAGSAAARLTRQVTVAANQPPVITLLGQASINVAFGAPFTDPGATAVDAEDGDLSAGIVVGGDTVDTGKAGTYTITYDVTDSAGSAATRRTRQVIVAANHRPVISLNGAASMRIELGSGYVDEGATASDQEDGDLTASIVVGGDVVNTAVVRTYIVTYNVSDSAGMAAAQVTRTVEVFDPAPPPPPPPPPVRRGGGGGAFAPAAIAVLGLLVLATRRRRPTICR